MEAGVSRGGPATSRTAAMDVAHTEDIFLLTDEKFDFDLSLSSSSANEDDEVFFGPVGHKERCIAASLNNRTPEQPLEPAPGSPGTWSPLTGEKFVEVYKEAHLLALRIESHGRKGAAQTASPGDPLSHGGEKFMQESKLKISLFEKEQKMERSPLSLKRETFCLSETSSMTLPLLGVQPPSGEPPSAALPSTSAPTQSTQRPPCTSQPLTGQPSTSHLPNQAGPPKRITSKLQPPRALAVRGRHPPPSLGKLKKEVPASLLRTKLLSEKEPHRDVLPDKPSVAPDAAHLPASAQPGPGKRSLPVPNKSGLKKTLLKPPGNSLSRKSTSSGSALSLPSGGRSSLAASKVKSSELSGIPTSSSQPLSNTSKLGRMGPTSQHQSLPAAPARGPDAAQPMAEQPKAPIPALSQPQTPEPRLDSDFISSASSQLNKTASIKRRDSQLNSKTRVLSTPTNPFKIPQFSIGESLDGATPKFCGAQRPQSWASGGRAVHSTPVRHSSGPNSQGLPGSMRTPMSSRRVSALPTPAIRRLSGLPLMTPQSMPRPVVSPLCVPARRLSSEPRKRSAVRAEPTWESDRSAGGEQVARSLSPEKSAPPPLVPLALHFSPEKSDFPLSQGSTTGAAQDRAEPREDLCPREALLDIGLDQLTITPEAQGQALADRPLIDFGSTPEAIMVSRANSRPLIDLMMNTPDADRSGVVQPTQAKLGQLIDLGSPLIQLSPEANKENVDSPLLKF